MSPSACLLRHLGQVQYLEWTASSPHESGWSGTGTGSVVVQTGPAGRLLLRETGLWQPQFGAQIRFRSGYSWFIIGPERVGLEHLRWGPDHPVYLLDLVWQGGGLWCSALPHHCREDRYDLKIQIQARKVRLKWTVIGPHKQDYLELRYF